MKNRDVNSPSWARMLYPSPMVGAPSVLVIDVPPEYRGTGLSLDRYYAMIIETDDECAEAERYVAKLRESPVAPSLLDHRPSNMLSETEIIAIFEPPERGWPWLSTTWWPDAFVQAALAHGITMARGCYTMEMFEDAKGLEAHSALMVEALAAHHPIQVRLISADQLLVGGTA